MTEHDVVLLPSFAQVENWRKRAARRCDAGLFSQTATTFDAWIADLWELHGDGREIVNSLQRQVIMHEVLRRAADADGVLHAHMDGGAGDAVGHDAAESGLHISPGVVKLAAQCVREAAGVPAFENTLSALAACESNDGHLVDRMVNGLSARESALLYGIVRYRDALSAASLVEFGEVLAYLGNRSDRVFPRPLRVLMDNAAPLDWQTACFFGSCDNLELEVREAAGAEGVQRVDQGIDLRFGFPSGRYAQPGLVADVVRSWFADTVGAEACSDAEFANADAHTCVVVCRDPLAFYRQVADELPNAGLALCVQARIPFSSTDFGRCFLSLCRCVHRDNWSIEDLSDAVTSSFSGIDRIDAFEFDAELRKDRLIERGRALSTLRSAYDTFSQLEEIALDPEADILLGVFEQMAFSSGQHSDAWRAEQLAAMQALRSCTSAARRVGSDITACLDVLEDVQVSLSFERVLAGEEEVVGADGATVSGLAASRAHAADGAKGLHRVVVTTQNAATQMDAGSCDLVILCDLTSEDYPIADKDDAAGTLFEKLGLQRSDTALARTRRTFAALELLPSRQLVCMRPLNDWDGNPTYPAPVLQELIDAYRPEASSEDEMYGLPASLLIGMVQRGEELLFANATARSTDACQRLSQAPKHRCQGGVSSEGVSKVALSRRSPDGSGLFGFSPSPSQVESYLDCPYRWFVQSRLNVETLDEGFGALERGSFAHAVLHEFYTRARQHGWTKVAPDNLAESRNLMREITDELERAQYALEPGSGRYVASSQIEQRELEMCKDQLVSFLDFEARFLPTFHPEYLEYEIKPEDGIVYAGHTFVGTVDRIDVDDAGNAVIVDYKGSVNASHEIAGKFPHNPGKVQARMYAQVIRRLLGLNVVGALYVSYGKARGCAGAFDARALDAAHLPSMKVEGSRCAVESSLGAPGEEGYGHLTFADMLDATEELVEHAIASMEAGIVGPNPATADSCTYCPAMNCPKRGAR